MATDSDLALHSQHDTDKWHHAIVGAPAWIRRYLVAREACETDNEAVRRARVSIAIVERESARNPVFAALRRKAEDRTLRLGVEDATYVARDSSAGIVQDAIEDSRSPTVRDGVRAQNRRLVLETAGLLQQAATTPNDSLILGLVDRLQAATAAWARESAAASERMAVEGRARPAIESPPREPDHN